MMTDAEWHGLQKTSAAAGMRVPASIIHRLASTGIGADARIGDTPRHVTISPVSNRGTWSGLNPRNSGPAPPAVY